MPVLQFYIPNFSDYKFTIGNIQFFPGRNKVYTYEPNSIVPPHMLPVSKNILSTRKGSLPLRPLYPLPSVRN